MRRLNEGGIDQKTSFEFAKAKRNFAEAKKSIQIEDTCPLPR